MRIVEVAERDRVREGQIPRHVAVIMDGNRRWAAAHGRTAEHAYAGVAPALVSTLREAVWLGVGHVSMFALSVNNLARDQRSLRQLLQIESWLWTDEVRAQAFDLNVKVDFVTSRPEVIAGVPVDGGPSSPDLFLHLCVGYSGRSSIMNRLSGEVTAGEGGGLVDVDLLIRTGGEERLSDFLVWESAQAELLFTDTLWPDFTGLHLTSAIHEYQGRSRRFGL